jgi:hypothetical protein
MRAMAMVRKATYAGPDLQQWDKWPKLSSQGDSTSGKLTGADRTRERIAECMV